jgi:hypothetical protein
MPVILTTPAEVDLWLAADAVKALELQRPLPDDVLRIVASGEREDRAPVVVCRILVGRMPVRIEHARGDGVRRGPMRSLMPGPIYPTAWLMDSIRLTASRSSPEAQKPPAGLMRPLCGKAQREGRRAPQRVTLSARERTARESREYASDAAMGVRNDGASATLARGRSEVGDRLARAKSASAAATPATRAALIERTG